jgi:D-glycero-alpha-D-manno-heptose 1-phosphate guanylyltransferase
MKENNIISKKQIVVLAGGFGTRLKSILKEQPKPLADINGTPFLEILIKKWLKLGFNDFVFSLYYQSELIINYLESERNGILSGCNIEYIVEPEPLGTGGAILYANSNCNLNDIFFVSNADTFIESNFSEMIESEPNSLAIIKVDNTARFGEVEISNEGKVTSLTEKNTKIKSGFINAGFYKFKKSVFSNLNIHNLSIENEILPDLIKKKQLGYIILEGKFIDIGVPEDYHKFCELNK